MDSRLGATDQSCVEKRVSKQGAAYLHCNRGGAIEAVHG